MAQKVLINGDKVLTFKSTSSNAVAKKWVINETPAAPAKTLEINAAGFYTPDGSTIQEITFLELGFDYYNNFRISDPATQYKRWADGNKLSNNTLVSFNMDNQRETYDEYSWDGFTADQKIQLRTITFETEPSGDLLTWLQANAVPVQEGSSKVLVADVVSAFETWVINEVPSANQDLQFTESFKSMDTYFDLIKIQTTELPPEMKVGISFLFYGTETEIVYQAGLGWANQAYRTIQLASPASGNFLTWLQANAVKQ